MQKISNRVNTLIIAVFITLSIISTFGGYYITTRFYKTVISNSSFLIENIIINDMRKFADEIFDKRYDSLEIHTNNLKRIKGIKNVDVLDDNFQSIISGKQYLDSRIVNSSKKNTTFFLDKESKFDMLTGIMPVSILNESFGFVVVDYSLEEFESIKNKILILFILSIAFTAITIGLVIYFYLSKTISRPIETLTSNIHKVVMENNKLQINLDYENEDELKSQLLNPALNELETLEKSFKIMMIRIKNYSDRMEENIKTLSGMLPICSNCKRIRDDNGYWQMVEVYIKEHSQAKFSHGLCPECAEKLYPEIMHNKNA